MKVQLQLTRLDIDHALAELLPLTLWLDEAHTRSLYIEKLAGVTIDPRGIKLVCGATLRFALPGIAPTLRLDVLELWVRPTLVAAQANSAGSVIAFELEVGEAGFAFLPAIARQGLVTALNLALERMPLRWPHEAALAVRVEMPALFSEIASFVTHAEHSELVLRGDTIHLSFNLRLGFERTPA